THFSPASDVYALAATMVFCLTGKRLPTAHEVTPKKLEAILPSTLPASLRSILMRSLSMHAEDRYADAAALLAAIEGDTLHDECGDDTTVVVEETLHDKPAKKSKQSDKPLKVKVVSAPRSAKTSVSGMKIALIVIAACLIVCGVAFLIWKSPSTPTQPQAVTDNPATSSTTDDDKLATYLNTISVQLNDVTTAEEFNAVLSEIEQKIQAYRDSQPNRVLTPEVKQALLHAQTALQNKAKELNLAPDLTAITELEQPQVQENAQQPQEQDAPKKEYADHDLSKIERNGQYGFADNEGNIIITCKYDYADSFSEGLAYVKKDGKYGYINKSGKEVIPLIYDWVGSFNDGLAVVKKDGQKGFVNKSGRIVIPLKYDNSHDCFWNGLCWVKKDGKWGAINTSGNVVIPLIYDNGNDCCEGFAAVEKDGKWGFVNMTGEVVITLIYDWTNFFQEGLAAVRKDGKYGFINTMGEVVIPLIYEGADWFDRGKATVKKDGEKFYIDKRGMRVN
ncbi:MAG: WG repeat-containing protein, partial [Muribaculaceae bacterium]|nr:WG repeat-containing protein [Muribaculaceae bacterium]